MTQPTLIDQTAEQIIDDLLQIHPKGFDLSLERISRLLVRLGNPQMNIPPAIHVAGTNGKGSTVAFMRSILEAAGHRVHVDTSPHLVRWHERFRLGSEDGGKLVSDEVFAGALKRVADENDGQPITVYEILTAVMFLMFSEHPADFSLIEVGLGGRFDSTNVIDRPLVSIITPISLDHEAHLGDSVEKIAMEKAGIIKTGVPVVVGAQLAAAREVLMETALRRGSPIWVEGQDFTTHEERGRLVYQDTNGLLDLPLPRLPGNHQVQNAGTAIAALRMAEIVLKNSDFEDGVLRATWPGRMQRLDHGHLADLCPEDAELWLDGGHNPGAAAAVTEVLAYLEERVPRPLVLICGMLTTKDPSGFFKQFCGLAERALTVPLATSDAGYEPAILAKLALEEGIQSEVAPNLREALLRLSRDPSAPAAPRILICGSLYIVGDALLENGTLPT